MIDLDAIGKRIAAYRKACGYTQEDLLPGVVIAGSSAMHERIQAGAATLSF